MFQVGGNIFSPLSKFNRFVYMVCFACSVIVSSLSTCAFSLPLVGPDSWQPDRTTIFPKDPKQLIFQSNLNIEYNYSEWLAFSSLCCFFSSSFSRSVYFMKVVQNPHFRGFWGTLKQGNPWTSPRLRTLLYSGPGLPLTILTSNSHKTDHHFRTVIGSDQSLPPLLAHSQSPLMASVQGL